MMLIALMGLPGSGKSALARRIAPILPAVILDKDVVRAALFTPKDIEYRVEQDNFIVNIMLQAAAYLMTKGRNVILDGRPFSRRYQVEMVVDFCREGAFPLKVIECTCSDESIRQRIETAAASGTHLARNRSFAMYLEMKARADPITIPRLVVDTDQPIEKCLKDCLDYLTTPE
jgi:predicted kinase